MRHTLIYTIDKQRFIRKLSNFLRNEKIFLILDSNYYSYNKFEFLAAWGVYRKFSITNENLFDKLFNFHNECKDWIFGHISYDIKNYIENLTSKNIDFIEFPEIFFFQPIYILEIEKNQARYHILSYFIDSAKNIHNLIEQADDNVNTNIQPLKFKKRITKSCYFESFNCIKQHIQKGDVYEMNFCQEFYVDNVEKLDIFSLFFKVKENNPMPFSCFYRIDDKFLLCASPERYLSKSKQTIISQPIKGTIRRGKNAEEDIIMYKKLKNSKKDCAENIMIVDLVRNDLSQTALRSSVKVKELCEIYYFPHVFQMISTIQSTLNPEKKFTDVIKTTFPMGSMTGAPKIKAMELIDRYETVKRGLYSGTVGYISPETDFDFNVVIRSLQYNASRQYASIITGGAITTYSKAEEEYDECILKAKSFLKAINSDIE